MKKQISTDAQQSERFKQAARGLGCDDPERFRERIKKLASAPPAPGPSKGKKVK